MPASTCSTCTGRPVARFSELELNLNTQGLSQRPLVLGDRVLMPIGLALARLRRAGGRSRDGPSRGCLWSVTFEAFRDFIWGDLKEGVLDLQRASAGRSAR
jgi:hypothetical protein